MITLSHEITEEMSRKMCKEPNFDEEILAQIVNDVIDEVIGIREYPDYYTIERIRDDVRKFKAKIKKIAEFDYGLIGGAGNKSRAENGVSVTFVDRNDYFSGIVRLARCN